MPKNEIKVKLVEMNGRLGVNNPQVSEAIKSIATGVKSKKSVNLELAEKTARALQEKEVHPVQRAVLFTALNIKGPIDDEKPLVDLIKKDVLENNQVLIDTLKNNSVLSSRENKLFLKLFRQEPLSFEESIDLGEYFFRDENNIETKAMAATILRMRHASAVEYSGLYQPLKKKLNDEFQSKWATERPVVQIAEPFDGVNRSLLLTPLIAKEIQSWGYCCVSMVGKSSGPKFENNLLQVAEKLDQKLIGWVTGSESLNQKIPTLGWYLDQSLLSPILDFWVDLRRMMIKRPFMATLEKYINPFKSEIFLSSAFHGPYGARMIDIAEALGFKAAIVVRKGREGSLAFSLSKPTEIYCTKKTDRGYERLEFEFHPQEASIAEQPDGRFEVSAELNSNSIEQYLSEGQLPGNNLDRLKVTLAGVRKAFDFIS